MKLLVCAALLAARAASADDGMRVGVAPGATVSFANAHSVTGYGGELWAGYEILRGRIGITPFGELAFYDFPHDPSSQLLLAMPAVKLGYHAGAWIPAARLGLGYARSWTASTTPSIRVSYVALSIGAELAHQVTDWLAIGIDFDYRPLVPTSVPTTDTFITFGASATVTL